MIIKIEIQHAVKSGLEKEALETIHKLNRKGPDHAACTLWKELILHSVLADVGDYVLPDNDTDQSALIQNFLNEPGKIRVLLSA